MWHLGQMKVSCFQRYSSYGRVHCSFQNCYFLCRSVVHRLGTRDDTGSRQDHRGPRDAGIDGTWSHDKFQKHDQLVSYPIHHQAILEQREERAMEGEVEKDENREHTENAMDTM